VAKFGEGRGSSEKKNPENRDTQGTRTIKWVNMHHDYPDDPCPVEQRREQPRKGRTSLETVSRTGGREGIKKRLRRSERAKV